MPCVSLLLWVAWQATHTFPWASEEGMAAQRLVAYVSDQTHACALKACRVAGMPEGNVRVLPITAASAYALTARQLLDAVQSDEAAGLIPFFLVLTVRGGHLVVPFFLTLTGGGSCKFPHVACRRCVAPHPPRHRPVRTDPLAPALTAVRSFLSTCLLCSSATSCQVGSTSSTAVDPIAPLAAIAKEHGMWVHVDAAYAGMASMCPEMRHHLAGVHLADSLASNAHKWLLTSFGCCCLWTQVGARRAGGRRGDADSTSLVEELSILPEYLRNKASERQQVGDYKDWEIPIGRRFRRHVALAEWFEEAVWQDERFEHATTCHPSPLPPAPQLMALRPFALICFRLKPPAPAAFTHSGIGAGEGGLDKGVEGTDGGREVNTALLEAINSSGQAYLTHTVLSGQYTLRMAIGAVKTEMTHVQAAWRLIQTEASKLLQEGKFPTARGQEEIASER
ncbi:unnamed protein product [Closterium sp. Naga37s-1]|nr:unnamed protein product [Closterium sp. Naga37s-1]